MRRGLAYYAVAAVVASLSIAVQATEVAPATHPSSGSPNPLRSAFLYPSADSSAYRHVQLARPKALIQRPKPDFAPPIVGIPRAEELKAIAESQRQLIWSRVRVGYVGRAMVRSTGAVALRVGIAIKTSTEGAIEMRTGADPNGEAQLLRLTASRDGGSKTFWSPFSSGDTQYIEIFSASPVDAIVDGVSSFTEDPLEAGGTASGEKVLSCEQNYSCSSDPNIKQSGPAVAKIVITIGNGESFLCSGALLNDRGSTGTPWFATATHCGITTQQIAGNVQFLWFFEQVCGVQSLVSNYRTTVGAQLLIADSNVDFTFLKVTGPLPGGLSSLGWSTSALASGDAVYGIHHPAGSPKAYSNGTFTDVETIHFRSEIDSSQVLAISSNAVNWQQGNTEQGSSGSPLLTGNGILRGTLSGGPSSPSCGAYRPSYYSRFALEYPLIRNWIDPGTVQDDFANSASATYTTQLDAYDSAAIQGTINYVGDEDWFRFQFPGPGDWLLTSLDYLGSTTNLMTQIYNSDGTTLLEQRDQTNIEPDGRNSLFLNHVLQPATLFVRTTGVSGSTGNYRLLSLYYPADDHSDILFLGDALAPTGVANGRIDRPGDADYFIIDLPVAGTLAVGTSGTTDTVGFLYDSSLNLVAKNDDISYPSNLNFSIQKRLPAGRYYLGVLGYDVTVLGPYTLTSSFTPASSGSNYTALWWNPQESGWGLNVNHQSSTIFATLFTYAADGSPMWLVASDLAALGPSTFSGALYRTSGPPFYQIPWSSISALQVGTMTLSFSGPEFGTVTYSVNGAVVTKSIQKQLFSSPIPVCSFSSITSRAASANYQDLWWNPAESGWGINFTHQGNILFATLFTYNPAGVAAWYVASDMERQPDGSFAGALYSTTGPAFNAVPWHSVSAVQVGNMSVRFTNGESGMLSYSINGISVTKSIQRQVFGANPPLCQ